jgi:hypothetical protein
MTNVPDPFGIWQRSAELARLGTQSLEEAERQARHLLGGLEGKQPDQRAPTADQRSLHDKLDALLGRALEQSTATSKQELFHRILDHLLPDEARVLSALSDGSTYPLVHVYARFKSSGEVLLENACLVGKMANVTLPHLTPIYVSNLLSWGLVEVGPEDPALKDDYMILMADTAVLKAVKAGSFGPIAPRVERFTLRISALGQELWDAATGESR